jgi:hypothetical protein
MGDCFVIEDGVPGATGPAEDTSTLIEKRDMVNQRLEARRVRDLKERGGGEERVNQIRAENIIVEVKAMRKKVKADICDLEEKSGSGDIAPLDLTDSLDSIAGTLAAMEKHLSQHAAMLPIYEVRALQATFKKIDEDFRVLQDSLQPKKKFGFRGGKKKKTEKKESVPKAASVAAPSVDLTIDGFTLSDRKDEKIVVGRDDVASKDVSFRRLESCVVHVLGSPSTIHATQLKNCTVLCGPVATSVFVEDCVDTTFVLACQQLRVHATKNTNFFLHVTSRAIVEDCSEARFGPYNLVYNGIDADYATAGLDKGVNNWEKVDDFNWLAKDKASPNWSLVPDDQWKKYEI